MFISVVLPQPDGPMIETNSPWRDVEADVVDDAHRPGGGREVDDDVVEADAHGAGCGVTVGAFGTGCSCDPVLPGDQPARRGAQRRSITSAIRPMQMMPT